MGAMNKKIKQLESTIFEPKKAVFFYFEALI